MTKETNDMDKLWNRLKKDCDNQSVTRSFKVNDLCPILANLNRRVEKLTGQKIQ